MNAPTTAVQSSMSTSTAQAESPPTAPLAPSEPSVHLLELAELNDGSSAAGEPIAHANPLHHLKANLQVSVGELTLTVGELLAAREQQVFVLDRRVEQPVDLVLDGRVVARGQLVAVDDQFAVQITERPVPLGV